MRAPPTACAEGKREIPFPLLPSAMKDGAVVAALRMSEVAIGGARRALLLGPLAVDQNYAGQGLGRTLIATAIEAAKAEGIALILLVGGRALLRPLRLQARAAGPDRASGPREPRAPPRPRTRRQALARMKGLVSAV